MQVGAQVPGGGDLRAGGGPGSSQVILNGAA